MASHLLDDSHYSKEVTKMSHSISGSKDPTQALSWTVVPLQGAKLWSQEQRLQQRFKNQCYKTQITSQKTDLVQKIGIFPLLLFHTSISVPSFSFPKWKNVCLLLWNTFKHNEKQWGNTSVTLYLLDMWQFSMDGGWGGGGNYECVGVKLDPKLVF